MSFIRVSWLDRLGWDETTHLLQNPTVVEARLQTIGKDDGGIQKRIRLELFHKKEAERKISRIQDDLLNDESIFSKKEAADKIEELRAIIQKSDTEIARLQSIAQVAKQSEEKVEATKKALEKLRDMNLQIATFQQKAELLARLGIKIYPSEDLTYMRMYCGLNITEPQKVSCYKTSIASPKL